MLFLQRYFLPTHVYICQTVPNISLTQDSGEFVTNSYQNVLHKNTVVPKLSKDVQAGVPMAVIKHHD